MTTRPLHTSRAISVSTNLLSRPRGLMYAKISRPTTGDPISFLSPPTSIREGPRKSVSEMRPHALVWGLFHAYMLDYVTDMPLACWHSLTVGCLRMVDPGRTYASCVLLVSTRLLKPL